MTEHNNADVSETRFRLGKVELVSRIGFLVLAAVTLLAALGGLIFSRDATPQDRIEMLVFLGTGAILVGLATWGLYAFFGDGLSITAQGMVWRSCGSVRKEIEWSQVKAVIWNTQNTRVLLEGTFGRRSVSLRRFGHSSRELIVAEIRRRLPSQVKQREARRTVLFGWRKFGVVRDDDLEPSPVVVPAEKAWIGMLVLVATSYALLVPCILFPQTLLLRRFVAAMVPFVLGVGLGAALVDAIRSRSWRALAVAMAALPAVGLWAWYVVRPLVLR